MGPVPFRVRDGLVWLRGVRVDDADEVGVGVCKLGDDGVVPEFAGAGVVAREDEVRDGVDFEGGEVDFCEGCCVGGDAFAEGERHGGWWGFT